MIYESKLQTQLVLVIQYTLFTQLEKRTHTHTHWTAHLAQVNNEAVSLVEAGPGHVHLGRSDGPATLDMQQALHTRVVGHHMLKT